MGVLRPDRTDMRGGAALKKRARRLRADMTDAERALWRAIRKDQLGQRFYRQFPIPPYIVDFACLDAGLIIECDGGQHVDSTEDARRDSYLRAKEWRILRFWNNDILTNRAGVLQTIADALKRQCGGDPHPDPPPLAGEGAAQYDGAGGFPPPQAGEG